MTIEDLEFLKKYESNFLTAINAGYSRNIPKNDLEKMVEIYSREKNIRYKLCYHCSSTVLSFIKELGSMYLVQKGNEQALNDKELEKEVTNSVDNTNECTTTNTKNNDEAVEQRKNNGIKRKRNAKYTTKQDK